MPAPEEPESPAGPDAVLRALADPHRRRIIRLVRDDELPAGQIATHFALTQQAVSQHLTVLKRAGLLDERRDGTRRLYRFRGESLEPVRELLEEFWPDALARLKRAVERDHPRKRIDMTTPHSSSTPPASTAPVVASVRIAASPEVVFPYFTDPVLATRWIADSAELDARPGGLFHVVVRGQPGPGRLRRGRPAPTRRLHLGHRRERATCPRGPARSRSTWWLRATRRS